jgi:hypothetical protein
MISREQFLDAFGREVKSIKHLYTKIPAGSMDWKPLEDMRTTRHLLQYLSFIGTAHMDLYLNTWPTIQEAIEKVKEHSANSSSLQPEDFPAAMDKEFESMKAKIEAIPEEDFKTRMTMDFAGNKIPLVDALLGDLRTFTAYRHQLFLYCRMNGAKIGTANNWRGVDPQPAPLPAVKNEKVPA